MDKNRNSFIVISLFIILDFIQIYYFFTNKFTALSDYLERMNNIGKTNGYEFQLSSSKGTIHSILKYKS